MQVKHKSFFTTLFFLLFSAVPAMAHVIAYQLDKRNKGEVFWDYLKIGFDHIIPLGVDHILFILCIFFLNSSLRKIILQASMFTLAHSITLAMAAYGIINPPAHVVEPLIAFSIVLLALENIFRNKVSSWRLIVVFIFGLIHGMGFAGALGDVGLPQKAFLTAVISFNIGVEFGQLAIIFGMFLLVALPFSKKHWYRKIIVIPSSVIIALIASYWTIERIFF